MGHQSEQGLVGSGDPAAGAPLGMPATLRAGWGAGHARPQGAACLRACSPASPGCCHGPSETLTFPGSKLPLVPSSPEEAGLP